jgi:hypothetical protein
MSSKWLGSIPKWFERANMDMEVTVETPRLEVLSSALEAIVEGMGKFTLAESHYMDPVPPMCVAEDMVCASCDFYESPTCELVEGTIAPTAMCHFFMPEGD